MYRVYVYPSARGQKPIFCVTSVPAAPQCGATCPNKTNKSGGPKDVADACLPPP